MKKRKIRLIIIDEKTGQEVLNEVSEDIHYKISNDLEKLPPKTGSYEPGPMYSRGYRIRLDGYFPNPNLEKDYKDAVEEYNA